MDRLDRGADAQCPVPVDAEQSSRRDAKQGPKALSAPDCRMPHGVEQDVPPVVAGHEQPLEELVNLASDAAGLGV